MGVIGIIECNFLKPAHNKQDFEYTKEYRYIKSKPSTGDELPLNFCSTLVIAKVKDLLYFYFVFIKFWKKKRFKYVILFSFCCQDSPLVL